MLRDSKIWDGFGERWIGGERWDSYLGYEFDQPDEDEEPEEPEDYPELDELEGEQ